MTNELRLWVDDERPAPDDTWTHAKTSEQARAVLYELHQKQLLGLTATLFEEISLDGDLGIIDDMEDSGEIVLDAIISSGFWPRVLTIHTANPVKRNRLLAAAKSRGADAPEGLVVRVRYW